MASVGGTEKKGANSSRSPLNVTGSTPVGAEIMFHSYPGILWWLLNLARDNISTVQTKQINLFWCFLFLDSLSCITCNYLSVTFANGTKVPMNLDPAIEDFDENCLEKPEFLSPLIVLTKVCQLVVLRVLWKPGFRSFLYTEVSYLGHSYSIYASLFRVPVRPCIHMDVPLWRVPLWICNQIRRWWTYT